MSSKTFRPHAFLAAASLTALLATSAAAQGTNLKPKLYLGGGIAALTNPSYFESIYAGNYSLLAAVGLPFTVGIEVTGKLQYHTFKLEKQWKDLGATDPNLKFITYGLDAKWSFLPPPVPARPYALVGVGQYTWKQDQVTVGPVRTAPVNESDIYFNLGLGVDVGLGPNFAIFAEIKHTILNQPGESFGILPIVIGARIL